MDTYTVVYLAAGMSSRFKGRIKALSKVGPSGETFLELSMNQAIQAGFDNFVIVASEKTVEPLRDYFGGAYKNIPISYGIQFTPDYREKPLGTSHALLAAKGFVLGPFVVLNSDDLYGRNVLAKLFHYLEKNKDGYCMPGYRLKNVLPEKGKVNRGIIQLDENGFLKEIEENFNLCIDCNPKFNGNELVSMNIFGLQLGFFDFLENEFKLFIKKHKNDPRIEFLLPDSITNFQREKNEKIAVITTEDKPIGLTNPEDEEKIRDMLSV